MNLDHVPELPGEGTEAIISKSVLIAPVGCYAMFGVGEHKLRRLAKHAFTYGFDCFTGLPEDWRDMPAGSFVQPVPVLDPVTDNCVIVKGLFKDTLPLFEPLEPLALVYIDCDLYSSTLDVLKELPRIAAPGCIVIFDEFYNYKGCEEHEQKALIDSGLAYAFLFRGEPCSEKVAIKLLG